MTKSTDTSLIEDTEIPAENLVEDLLDEQDENDLDDNDVDEDHATVVSAPVDPATDLNLGTVQRLVDLSAIMATHR